MYDTYCNKSMVTVEQRSPEKLEKKALPTKLGGVTESKSTFKIFSIFYRKSGFYLYFLPLKPIKVV